MSILVYMTLWNAIWQPFGCTGGIQRLVKQREISDALLVVLTHWLCWRGFQQLGKKGQ